MDKKSKKILGIFSRYIFLVLIGLGNLYIFYKLLIPATTKIVAAILSISNQLVAVDNIIFMKNIMIEIAPACVAGAAFYLMFLLVFSTADIKPIKRFYIILSAALILFALNVARIVFLTSISTLSSFAIIHWVFWHLISTIFVIGIWLLMVKLYKIKSVPIYSDMKYLVSLIKPAKKSKRSKKN